MYSAKSSEKAPRKVAVYQRRARVGASDGDLRRSDESIEYCLRQFGEVPLIFNDDGRSGCNPDRAGLRKLMAGVESGEIRALVVRNVSTLSREILDLVRIYKKLDSHDVELHEVSSGGLISGPALLINVKKAALPEIR